MKLRTALLLGLLVVAVVGVAGYLGMRSARPAAVVVDETPVTIPVTRGDVAQTVTAPGLLVNTSEAILSFNFEIALFRDNPLGKGQLGFPQGRHGPSVDVHFGNTGIVKNKT